MKQKITNHKLDDIIQFKRLSHPYLCLSEDWVVCHGLIRKIWAGVVPRFFYLKPLVICVVLCNDIRTAHEGKLQVERLEEKPGLTTWLFAFIGIQHISPTGDR